MIMLHSDNQNYYGNPLFLSFFAIFQYINANSTPVNLIFKGSDFRRFD